MKKSKSYAGLYTMRSDGRYMGYWHELDRDGRPTGPRHAIYDRDPAKLHRRIQEKETPVPRTLRVVAGEWEQLHRDAVKARTWANYKPQMEHILDRYGDLPVAEITAVEVTQDLLWAKSLKFSYTVVNTRRSIWRGILDHAVAMRDMPYNPATSVRLPKGLQHGKRESPPDDVLTAILAGADDMDFGFVPFFLLCTGLRRSEALHRRIGDVDLERWELRIPESKTAAGIRTVPLIEPLREPLQRWIAAHPGEWLFPRRDYYAGRKDGSRPGHMSDSNWDTAWANYCEAHGWTDDEGKPLYGAHHLRHGTATLLYESGVDVYVAQHILGHANVTTTLEIYTTLRREHETQNVDLFRDKLSSMLSKTQKSPK